MTTPPQPSGPPEPEWDAGTPAAPYGQPPPGQPGSYGYPGYPGQRPTNGFAIASLVLGILIVVSWGLTGILALIFGYIARKQIRERGQAGAGLAVAGIVLGWVAVGFLVLIAVLLFIPLFPFF